MKQYYSCLISNIVKETLNFFNEIEIMTIENQITLKLLYILVDMLEISLIGPQFNDNNGS